VTDEETPPPLRDRNRFFHWFLNGDRTTFERVAPRWREQRRNVRKAGRLEKKTDPVRRTPDLGDSRFRELQAQVEKEKSVQRSCRRMKSSIRAAQRRIRHASKRRARDDATRAAVNQDAKEIAKRIRAVRKYALRVNQQMSPDSPFDLAKLDIEFADGDVDRKVRNRKYQDIKALLSAFEESADSIRRGIASRRKAFERERRARRGRTS